MVYIRTKTVYGRQYLYLVEGKRVNDKVMQRVVRYMGASDPVYKKKQRRSNAWLFVRELTTKEIETLKKAKRSSDAFRRDRARILLFSAEKTPVKEIARKLDCDEWKVRTTIHSFDQDALVSLKRKTSGGKPPKFTKEQRAKILKIASTDPRKISLPFTTWSLPKLRDYLMENDVVESICIESVRRILKSFGMKLRKSRRWQYSNDPDFDKKNFELMN